MRAGDGPAFIEAITYRFVGHSRSDPGRVPPEGELEQWKKRDPIVVARAQLEAEGVEGARLDALEHESRKSWNACVEAGLAAPYPSASAGREFKD